jgi:hypothetical protein
MKQDPRLHTALSLITARELQRLQQRQTPLVETRSEPIHSYDETLRLTISTVSTQSAEYRSGVHGWLIGVSIFADAIDINDTMRVTLKGRDLKQGLRPRANFSIEEDFFEEIEMADRVTLYYQSTGTTLKNIDFTPRVSYPRPQV